MIYRHDTRSYVLVYNMSIGRPQKKEKGPHVGRNRQRKLINEINGLIPPSLEHSVEE